jgi:hypothetical protein
MNSFERSLSFLSYRFSIVLTLTITASLFTRLEFIQFISMGRLMISYRFSPIKFRLVSTSGAI